MIAAGAALGVELGQGLAQPIEPGFIVEGALYEAQSLSQPLPNRLAKRGTAVFFDVVEYHLGESVMIPVAARKTHQREGRWQQATVCQVIDRRHHFFMSQVAGDAEKDNGARTGDLR